MNHQQINNHKNQQNTHKFRPTIRTHDNIGLTNKKKTKQHTKCNGPNMLSRLRENVYKINNSKVMN